MRWLLCIVLFLVSCGGNMPELDGNRWLTHKQRDFSGGENLSLPANEIPRNQLSRLENVRLNPLKQLSNNDGRVPLTADMLGVYSAWDFQKSNGSRFLIIADSSGKIKAKSWDGVTPQSYWVGSIDSSFFTTTNVQAVQWHDVMIFCNGEDTPIYFNGTTFATISGAPKLYCPKVYKEKLWGIDGDNPTHICFSGAGSYTAWDALDFVTIDGGDGDVVTQISPQVGGLIVFTETDNAAIYGSSLDDISVNLHHFQNRVGCPSAKQGAVLDQGYVFSTTGIYRFDFNQIRKIETQDNFFNPAGFLAAWPLRNSQQVLLSIVGAYDYVNKRAIFASTTFWHNVRTKSVSGLSIDNDCYGIAIEDNGATSKVKILDISANIYNLCEFKNIELQQYNFLILSQDVHAIKPGTVTNTLPVVVQTRSENFDTSQDKWFRAFSITVAASVNAVTLKYSLNGGSLVTAGTYNLIAGENIFWLNNVRGETISFEITTANPITITELGWKYKPIGKVFK